VFTCVYSMDRVDPTDVRLCLEANRNCGHSVDGVCVRRSPQRPPVGRRCGAASGGRLLLARSEFCPDSPTDAFLYRTIETGDVSRVDSTSRARLVRTANRRCRKLRLSLRVKPCISLSSVPVSRNRLSSSRLQDTGYKTLADW